MGDEVKNDDTIFKLVEMIKIQFETELDLFNWTKDIFQKVTFYLGYWVNPTSNGYFSSKLENLKDTIFTFLWRLIV